MNYVTLTEAAAIHIRKIMARHEHGVAFRLSVKQAGCTGYKYQPEVVACIPEGDYQFTTQGVHVCLDPTCLAMIQGTVIDFMSKGPGQNQLVFNNPNIDSECGCGESFYLKEKADAEKKR